MHKTQPQLKCSQLEVETLLCLNVVLTLRLDYYACITHVLVVLVL